MFNVQQITSRLSEMSDSQLAQYARMHKDDPYILPLAASESKRRQQLRQSAQVPQATQATVADQSVAQMEEQGLPEDTGISNLPEQSLVNMADGGIAGYARGGAPEDTSTYRQYAISKARQMGLDPKFVDAIFNIESGYQSKAKSRTGPVGVGQLTSQVAKYYGLDPKERTDPYKNMDASIAFMKDLFTKYKDPAKVAIAYNQGEGVLNEHLKQNKGKLVPEKLHENVKTANKQEPLNYLKKLTDYIPISSAAAADVVPRGEFTLPKELAASVPAAPATAAPQAAPTRTSPQSMSGTVGRVPEPVSGIGMTGIPLTPPDQPSTGIAAAAPGTPSPTERYERTSPRSISGPVTKPGQKLPTVDTFKPKQGIAALAEDVPRDPMTGIPLVTPPGTPEPDSWSTIGKRVASTFFPMPDTEKELADIDRQRRYEEIMGGPVNVSSGASGFPVSYTADLGLPAVEPEAEAPAAPETETPAVGEAKPAEEKPAGFGLSNEDILMMGLNMMQAPAGQPGSEFSQLASNLGRSGLATIAAKREREKVAQEQTYRKALEDYYKAIGGRQAAETDFLLNEKADLTKRRAAATEITKRMAAWEKSRTAGLQGMTPVTDAERAAQEAKIAQDVYKTLGLSYTGPVAAPAVDTTGFKVVGVR